MESGQGSVEEPAAQAWLRLHKHAYRPSQESWENRDQGALTVQISLTLPQLPSGFLCQMR